jgi:hypothetical protein
MHPTTAHVSLGMAPTAGERDAEKLEFVEEMTKGFDSEQVRVVAEILARNNGAEYLWCHGTDREAFKARVPMVTYEDLRPEIERIANGDRSNIISSHPITKLLTRYLQLVFLLIFFFVGPSYQSLVVGSMVQLHQPMQRLINRPVN